MEAKITPHKGGRTERLEVRLEPEIKAYLMTHGSAADWITKSVRAELDSEFKEWDGVIIEAQDNGEKIDLGWAMRLLWQYGMYIPDDPKSVRWLAGSEAAAEWQQQKDDGYKPLESWTDEDPFISWLD